MPNLHIKSSKQILQPQWVAFFDMLSDGKRGRKIKLNVSDPDAGDFEPIRGTPLLAIVCDPPNKGNDIVIETGKTEVNYAHTVNAPTEVWEAKDENGKLIALEIKDKTGTQTIISFLT